jgi:hypothetical protein
MQKKARYITISETEDRLNYSQGILPNATRCHCTKRSFLLANDIATYLICLLLTNGSYDMDHMLIVLRWICLNRSRIFPPQNVPSSASELVTTNIREVISYGPAADTILIQIQNL